MFDSFELSGNGGYRSLATWSKDDAIRRRVEQIHSRSYVDSGYFSEESINSEGIFKNTVKSYWSDKETEKALDSIAIIIGKTSETILEIEKADSTATLIHPKNKKGVKFLPTMRTLFEHDLTNEAQRIDDLFTEENPSDLREFTSLATIDPTHKGSYEVVKSVLKNSLLKEFETGRREVIIASLTTLALNPIASFIGSHSFEILSEPLKTLENNEHSLDIWLVPVIIYPYKIISGFQKVLDDLVSSNADKGAIKRLQHHLDYLKS